MTDVDHSYDFLDEGGDRNSAPPVSRSSVIRPVDPPLPCDIDAQKSVAVVELSTPGALGDSLKIAPWNQWFGATWQRIARAITEILQAGQVPDITSVGRWLKAHEQFGDVQAEIRDLASLADHPYVGNAEQHARVIHDHYVRRIRIQVEQRRLAQLREGKRPIDDVDREADEQLSALIGPVEPPPVIDLGAWATDLGDMCAEPEREAWLLRDEITGKPALPISRVALLAASGGTGKTTTLAQLAVSTTLGSSWCGFSIETPGRVVLASGESDAKLMHRHLWRACNALSLSRVERARAMEQIFALPLAGREVNILRGSGNDLERTEFLALFRGHLEKLATEGGFGWSLIILDPLSRFAGPDTEKDNSAATKFAQAVESLCTLPGAPAVIVAHHSSKNSIRAGSNDARGVSGLRDAFRTVMLMTKCQADDGIVGVEMRCDKANEAPEFAARWLVRQSREPMPDGGWIDVGGTLRLASDRESAALDAAAGTRNGATQEQREGQKIERTKIKHQALLDALVSVIPIEPAHVNQGEAEIRLRATGYSLSPVTLKSTLAWLASAEGGRRVIDLSDGSKGKPRQWARSGMKS